MAGWGSYHYLAEPPSTRGKAGTIPRDTESPLRPPESASPLSTTCQDRIGRDGPGSLTDDKANGYIDGNDLDQQVLGQTYTVANRISYVFLGRHNILGRWGEPTDVKRLYMMRRQALTVQIVTHCICSTTRTIFEPYSLSAITSGVSSMGFFGSMRLLFVRTMTFMPAMRTVSVIWGSQGQHGTLCGLFPAAVRGGGKLGRPSGVFRTIAKIMR